MCLGIPGEVVEILEDRPDLARVNVSGDWVLIHVGFALSKIDEAEASAALAFLEGIGQAYTDELRALADSKIE
jgi:hydrogenase expression/formation protein HypC